MRTTVGAGEGVAVEFTVSLDIEGLWARVDVTDGELVGVLLFDLTNFEKILVGMPASTKKRYEKTTINGYSQHLIYR